MDLFSKPQAGMITLLGVLVLAGACSSTPEQRRARFLEQAGTHQARGDRSRALIDYLNAAQAVPGKAAAEPYYRAAELQAAQEAFSQSAVLLRKAVEADPAHVLARLRLAAMMSVTGSRDLAAEAGRHLTAALASALDSPEGLTTAAFVEIQLERPAEAAAHLELAVRQFPGDTTAATMLAAVRASEKNAAEAERLLDAAAATARAADEVTGIGRQYAMLGRLVKTRQMAERALRANPHHGPALSDLAALELRAGNRRGAEEIYARLSKLNDARYRPLHAMYLAAGKRWSEAIAELEALYRSNPSDRELRTLLVSALAAGGKQQRAAAVLAEALVANSNDVQALVQRAHLMLGGGDPAAAEADLARALEFEPSSATAHFHMARVHRARRNPALQQQELIEALRLDPSMLEARLDLADRLLAANRARAALEAVAAAPPAQRGNYRLQVRRVSALMGSGDRAGAATLAGQLRERLESPMVLLQIATLQLAGNDIGAARPTLRRLLQLEPENVRALEYLASTFARRDSAEEALAVVRAHAGAHPRSARLRFVLAQWLAETAHLGEARAAYEEARRLDPAPVGADLALAQLDVADSKPEAAQKRIEAVLARDRSNVQALFQLGNVHQIRGRFAAAAEQYRKVVELDPASTLAKNNLAYVLAEHLNRPAEALPYIQRAKELEPDNPVIDDTLGWVMLKLGQTRQAVQYLESSVKRAATAESAQHLSLALYKAGDARRGDHFKAESARLRAREGVLRGEGS